MSSDSRGKLSREQLNRVFNAEAHKAFVPGQRYKGRAVSRATPGMADMFQYAYR